MDRPKPGASLDDVLTHYGVKGMHWGVRRNRSSGSTPTSSDAARAKTHAETAKRHGASALSNKELQDLVTRMNLERQYSTLKGETQVKKGQKVIKEILGLGRTANDVIQFVNSPIGKHLRKQFTSA